MEDICDRLRQARIAAGFRSAQAAADALGLSASTYRAHENGQNDIPPSMILTYARKFRVDTKWLLEGVGEMTPTEEQKQFFDISDTLSKRAKNRMKIDLGRAGDVPQFNIHAGMGAGGALSVMVGDDGLAIDPEDSDGFWSFPDSVKAGMRDLRKIYAMPVTGDSMEPTLPGGSFVFVDITHKIPSPEDIYALDYGDGLMVKRVQMIPKSDKLMVISDNDHYQDYELLRDDVHVYGRVVAWFQWRG